MLRRLRWVLLPLVAILLAGCRNNVVERAGFTTPVTDKGSAVLGFWQGSIVAALCVGAFVIFLILWSCIRFRRRSPDDLPRQVRYNLPIEVLYTAIPVIIVSFLFYFTVIRENDSTSLAAKPQLRIGVVGYQWAWRFNYLDDGLSVSGAVGELPTLVLPVGKEVEFYLDSPDVIHSFKVVPFEFTRDVIPGFTNRFEVKVTQPGFWRGECAEYCGVNHDRMLFYVRAVPYPQFEQWLAQAKAQAQAGIGNDQYSIYTGPATPTYNSVEGYS